MSLAWPRTFTLLATTDAGPGTSGVVFKSNTGSAFLATGFFSVDFFSATFFSAGLLDFFLADFFLAGLAAGALVAGASAEIVAAGAAAGVAMRAAVGAFDTVCATRLLESIIPRNNQ